MLTVLIAFVVLVPTVRAYVSQQEQQRDLNRQLTAAQEEATALENELARWQDPDYVRTQARERFGYVLPGETAYRVVDPETVVGEDPIADLMASEDSRPQYAPATSDPWYVSVWQSVEVAGAAADAIEGGDGAGGGLPDGSDLDPEAGVDTDGAAGSPGADPVETP